MHHVSAGAIASAAASTAAAAACLRHQVLRRSHPGGGCRAMTCTPGPPMAAHHPRTTHGCAPSTTHAEKEPTVTTNAAQLVQLCGTSATASHQGSIRPTFPNSTAGGDCPTVLLVVTAMARQSLSCSDLHCPNSLHDGAHPSGAARTHHLCWCAVSTLLHMSHTSRPLMP